jgi:hypothetical protein
MDERRFLPEDELNRYWNDLVADERSSAAPPGSLDPVAVETMRWLARVGAIPAPASSRERVRRGVQERLHLDAPGVTQGRDSALPASTRARNGRHRLPATDLVGNRPMDAGLGLSPSALSNGRVPHADIGVNGRNSGAPASQSLASLPSPVAQVRTLTHVAAAVILFIAIASAMVALLYPHRPWEVGERPSIAVSEPTAVETALTGETTLLDLTLTEMPTFRAQLGIFIATLLPGTQTELRSGAGPDLFYVAEGPITVRAWTAPEPLEVIPPESAGARPPAAFIAQGEQATMETGSTLLIPGGAVINLFTTSSTTGRVVDLLSATDSRRQGDGANVQFASNGGMTVDLAAPVAIALRQGTLPPEATLPAPSSDDTRQIVATLDAAAMGDLRSGMGGSVRNAGEKPVELYVLSVTTGPALGPLQETHVVDANSWVAGS